MDKKTNTVKKENKGHTKKQEKKKEERCKK